MRNPCYHCISAVGIGIAKLLNDERKYALPFSGAQIMASTGGFK
jgi:hypothetical protein